MNQVTTSKLSSGKYVATVDTPDGQSFEVLITDLRPRYDIPKWRIELRLTSSVFHEINTYFETKRDCLLVLTHSFNPSKHIR